MAGAGRLISRPVASSRWTECQIPDLLNERILCGLRLKVAWSNVR